MKIYQKLLATLTLLFILSLALPGLASAETLQGRGRLYAKGNGRAVLRMTGQVEITGHGKSVVKIIGAEKIEAHGEGERINQPDGSVVFRGFEGKILVVGRKMVVRMTGKQIEFVAKGKGKALLKGRGIYKTANLSGDWTSDGVEIKLSE
jgi:hypothetical protein